MQLIWSFAGLHRKGLSRLNSDVTMVKSSMTRGCRKLQIYFIYTIGIVIICTTVL